MKYERFKSCGHRCERYFFFNNVLAPSKWFLIALN